MKVHKLEHYCQNKKAHNGQQHGFYINLGKYKITARMKHLFSMRKVLLPKCPQCGSSDVKVGRLLTGRKDA